jgi:hypothetical protein
VLDVVEAFGWASDSIRKMVAYFEGTAEGRQQLAAAAAAATAPVQAAAAAASGGATRRVNGLSEEQQWAMIQAEGQSISLQQQELPEQQQQHDQAELQQQLLQGYLFLGNLIDVYGALGRGAAAEGHRQRLAAAATAARRTRAGQQQPQQQHGQRHAVSGQAQLHIVNGQLQGVKLTGKKAKKLKIAGLDKQPGGGTAAAAARPAAAAAAGAAAAAAAGPVVTVSRLVADPQMLAVIDLGIGKKNQRMRPQIVLEQYGSSLRAVAAAEDALKKADLAAAAAAAQAARDRLADAAGAALAAAEDGKKSTDVAALLEATEVSVTSVPMQQQAVWLLHRVELAIARGCGTAVLCWCVACQGICRCQLDQTED